jgi:hypothetical protein
MNLHELAAGFEDPVESCSVIAASSDSSPARRLPDTSRLRRERRGDVAAASALHCFEPRCCTRRTERDLLPLLQRIAAACGSFRDFKRRLEADHREMNRLARAAPAAAGDREEWCGAPVSEVSISAPSPPPISIEGALHALAMRHLQPEDREALVAAQPLGFVIDPSHG